MSGEENTSRGVAIAQGTPKIPESNAVRALNQADVELIDQHLYEQGLKERLLTIAMCLSGGKEMGLREETVYMDGGNPVAQSYEPLPAQEIDTTIGQLENLVSSTIELNNELGQDDRKIAVEVAGTVQVVLTQLQPLEDGNKQTARLMGQSYLHQLHPESREYWLPYPDRELATSAINVVDNDLFTSELPYQENLEKVLDETILNESQKEAVREYYADHVNQDTKKSTTLQERSGAIKNIYAIANEDVRAVVEEDRAEDYGANVLGEIGTMLRKLQIDGWVRGIVSNKEAFQKYCMNGQIENPEIKLLGKFVEKYREALETLEDTKDHEEKLAEIKKWIK